MASLRDLMRVASRSRETVIREIEAGNMPGYAVTSEEGHISYHVPDDALALYAAGYWIPHSKRPIHPTPFLWRRVEDVSPTPTE